MTVESPVNCSKIVDRLVLRVSNPYFVDEIKKNLPDTVIYINWKHRWFLAEFETSLGRKLQEYFHFQAS